MLLPADLIKKLSDCAAHDFLDAKATWSVWLSVATWTVVVGLLLELPELMYEAKDIARQRIDRLKYKVILLEHRAQIAKLAAFLGWFLIVLGVYGEVKAGDELNQIGSSIQTCSDAKVREATLEAGDAAQSAKTAHDEADAVKGIADEANQYARNSLTIARSAHGEVASIKTGIDSTKRDFEALEREVRPRRLSPEQITELVRELKPCVVAVPPFVKWTDGAIIDGQIYGQDFMNVLSQTGCPVGLNIGMDFMTPRMIGIRVIAHDWPSWAAKKGAFGGKFPPYWALVLKALNDNGVRASQDVDVNVPEGTFLIRIGAKK